MNRKTLRELKTGEDGIISKIGGNGDIRRRLSDLGMCKGTNISCVLNAPFGGMSAYLIRGTLIAIRKRDADNILLRV